VVADIHFKDKKTVLHNKKNITHPAWSPDGSKIAYNDGKELKLVAPDGSWQKAVNFGKKQLFSTCPGFALAPAWSPDGTKLAITCLEPLGGEIGVMDNYMPKAKLAAK
jgi:Tol biopolymer transport system component